MTNPLADAARKRATECLAAVERVVTELQQNGQPVSLRDVAQRAGVSRNYIYTTPAAKELVLGARSSQAKSTRSLTSRPASDESLKMRLQAALQRIDELELDNGQLRQRNDALVEEVIRLQNPEPENVTSIRRRRG
jgi:AcrR family transcriptional regulator